MIDFENIPSKYIRQLAKKHGIKHRGKNENEIVNELVNAGKSDLINYLNNQFRYAGKNLTLCKSDEFPQKSKTPDLFIQSLINEKYITEDLIGKEWRPTLKPEIQLCAIDVDGSDVYIKLVEERTTIRKNGYSKSVYSYAHFVSAVIHFANEVIELRCPYNERTRYASYLMKLMGFREPYELVWLTHVTKDEAIEICKILSAGLSSTHIAIPSTVGSLVFNGRKGVNLRNDDGFRNIIGAIEKLGLPTNDTLDEICYFKFEDPVTQIEIDVSFEVNLKNGGFKFTTTVPEKVYEQVIDAFIKVCYVNKQKALEEIASTDE